MPRRPGNELDDRQRRAMFARMGGGGGGGGKGRAARSAGSRGSGSGGSASPAGRARAAADMSDIEQKLKDYGVWGGIMGPSAPVPARVQNFLSRIKALPTAIGAAATSATLGAVRSQNPTMDPRAEHYLAMAQQLAAYAAAIAGLKGGKQVIGAGLKRIPLGGSNVAEKTSETLARFGNILTRLGTAASSKLPTPLRKAADKLYQTYSTLADYTGASLADLGNVPGAAGKLSGARGLRQRAAELRAQAAEIEAAAGAKGLDEKAKAGRILAKSHEGSLVDWQSAQRMYGEGAAKWYDAEYGSVASRRVARLMRERADRLEGKATDMAHQGRAGLVKGGLVAGGLAAKEIHDESRIRSLQREMDAAFREGESFTLPAAQPRSGLELAVAVAAGTLGNPIEKQFRYGQDQYLASVAAYRTKHAQIVEAGRTGELTPQEARTELAALAKYKPQNMAGKTLWTFAPASASFLAWKGKEVADHFNQSARVGRVKRVLDGDTIELASGEIVRMMGVDTPESVHPRKPAEYLGPEASAWQKRQLSGKYVKIVDDPRTTKEKYGRSIGFIETLPGPLDKALAIPGLGKYIPAVDQNKRTIAAGFGQPRYLELSGGHAREIEYDKATLRAMQKAVGVHSAEGREKLEYHYTPYQEKQRQAAAKRGISLPASTEGGITTPLGIGLMTTGQAGVFKPMGAAGTAIAQAWNASLAALGAREFNREAKANPIPVTRGKSKAVKTEHEKHVDRVLDRRHLGIR